MFNLELNCVILKCELDVTKGVRRIDVNGLRLLRHSF